MFDYEPGILSEDTALAPDETGPPGPFQLLKWQIRESLPGRSKWGPHSDRGSAHDSDITPDRSTLSGYDLVELMRAQGRKIAQVQGELMETIAALAFRADPEFGCAQDPFEFVGDEVAAALHLTRRGGEDHVHLAMQLRRRYPSVLNLLKRGVIDIRQARVLVESTEHLPPAITAEVVEKVITAAPGLTTGQLRARLQRLCMERSPEDYARRLEAGLKDRRVVVEATGDGTANLMLLSVPAERAMAIRRMIYRLANNARTAGDERTADQRRADVLLDLLTNGGGQTAGRAQVDIVVELETLIGLSDAPAHLPGWGPVVAEIARKTVNEQTTSRWGFIVTDGGRPLETGPVRRRPTAGQKRNVVAVHATCVFPGCRMPSSESDLDHREPHSAGGPTVEENLAPLCRHHHRVKHEAGWILRKSGHAEYRWTSRLGHSYTVSGTDPPTETN